jgi:hypothetical protein
MSLRDIAFAVGILLSISVYLGSLSYLSDHLRRVYTMTWVNLGNPLDLPRKPTLGDLMEKAKSSDRIFGFIWSDQYKSVQDRRMAALVWTARISCSLFTILLIAAVVVSHID